MNNVQAHQINGGTSGSSTKPSSVSGLHCTVGGALELGGLLTTAAAVGGTTVDRVVAIML